MGLTPKQRHARGLARLLGNAGAFVENTEILEPLFESQMTMAVSDDDRHNLESLVPLLAQTVYASLQRGHKDEVHDAYVVCLDCGKKFPYDMQAMRVGRALPADPKGAILHPPVVPTRSRLRYAIWGWAIPAVLFLCKAVFTKRTAPAETRPADGHSANKRDLT